MADISSYPQATPKGSDRVLGVQAYVEGDDSTVGNPTKTFTINDINNLVPGSGGDSLYTTRTVELTPAQMLSLNGGGILELIPAPGAGKIIVVLEALLFLDYGGVAYNFSGAGGRVTITYDTGDVGPFSLTNILNRTTDFYTNPTFDYLYPEVNKALTLRNTSATVTAGNSLVKFNIVYRILDATTLL